MLPELAAATSCRQRAQWARATGGEGRVRTTTSSAVSYSTDIYSPWFFKSGVKRLMSSHHDGMQLLARLLLIARDVLCSWSFCRGQHICLPVSGVKFSLNLSVLSYYSVRNYCPFRIILAVLVTCKERVGNSWHILNGRQTE